MPEYMRPRNDKARLGFLRRAIYTVKQDHKLGNHYIGDTLVEAIDAFIPLFEKRLNPVRSYLSQRSKEVRESRESLSTLKIYVRDMWNVLKRRVRRLNQPASVLNFYGLPQNGHAPNPTSTHTWFGLAGELIKGDELAVNAGYPSMSNPSAAELKEILEQARQETRDVFSADREYDDIQADLEALRPRADELIKEVMAELRFNLRHFDRPSQRRIMRTYGVVFRYRKKEAGEEGEEEY